MTGLTVSQHADTPHQIVRVAGDLDFTVIGEVSEQLEPVLQRVSGRLIVDLSDTTFLDSAGIKLIYDIHGTLTARNQRLQVVVAAGNLVRRTLELTGTTESFALYGDVGSAVRESSG